MEIDPKTRNIRRMEKLFITAGQPRPDPFSSGGRIPIIGGRDGPGIGRESKQKDVVAELVPHQLPGIELATLTHLSRARVAQMSVMRPDHDLASAGVKTGKQCLNRPSHVP